MSWGSSSTTRTSGSLGGGSRALGRHGDSSAGGGGGDAAEREGEDEARAARLACLRVDVAAVRGRDRAHDGEPETRARAARRPVELVEDAFGRFGGKPGPSSLTSIEHLVAVAPRGNGDAAFASAVPDRVLEQVDDRLFDEHGVEQDEGQVRRHAHVQAALSGVALDPGCGGSQDLLERVPLALGLRACRTRGASCPAGCRRVG